MSTPDQQKGTKGRVGLPPLSHPMNEDATALILPKLWALQSILTSLDYGCEGGQADPGGWGFQAAKDAADALEVEILRHASTEHFRDERHALEWRNA